MRITTYDRYGTNDEFFFLHLVSAGEQNGDRNALRPLTLYRQVQNNKGRRVERRLVHLKK